MTITKTGQRLEKRSSILGGAGILGSLHVGQNALAKKWLTKPSFHKQLYNKMSGNLAENLHKGNINSEIQQGLKSGVVPELNIVQNELDNLSKNVINKLSEQGIDPSKLSLNDVKALKRFAKGDFRRAMNTSLSPDRKDQLMQALTDAFPDKNLGVVMKAAKNKNIPVEPLLDDIGDAYKNNSILGPLGKGLSKNIGKAPKLPDSRHRAELANKFSDAGSSIGVTLLDTLSGGFNAAKKYVGSKELGQSIKPLKKVQDNITNTFVSEPIQKSFNKGLAGEQYSFPKARKAVKEYGANPLTASIEDFSNKLGGVARKHGITPEDIDKVKNYKYNFEFDKDGIPLSEYVF